MTSIEISSYRGEFYEIKCQVGPGYGPTWHDPGEPGEITVNAALVEEWSDEADDFIRRPATEDEIDDLTCDWTFCEEVHVAAHEAEEADRYDRDRDWYGD